MSAPFTRSRYAFAPAVLLLILGFTMTVGRGGAPAAAQTGGPYELVWSSTASGGTASGGAYDLSAAIGQPEAATMSGGDYTLGGGVWGGGANPLVPGLYLPVIVR